MRKGWIVSIVSGMLFVALIAFVLAYDVAAIGPNGTEIGLSHINQAVHEAIGSHMLWYNITEVLGVVSLLVAATFAGLGCYQMVRRKSLLKVDKQIYVLAGLYVVTMMMYVLFEKVVINYRPVIMPGDELPEAAFPSSHTMLTCVIMGSALPMIKSYVKNTKLQLALEIVCIVIAVTMVAGRLLSGVHWLTDIFGAVLLSVTLLGIFDGIKEIVNKK